MENPFYQLNERLIRIESQLEILNSQPIFGTIQAPKFFNAREAAVFLGISVQTLYNYTSKGEVPNMKRGKLLYFAEADLVDWLRESQRGGSNSISDD